MKLANLKWKESSDTNRWYAHSSCGRKVFSVWNQEDTWVAYCDLTRLFIGHKLDVEAAIRRRDEELSK